MKGQEGVARIWLFGLAAWVAPALAFAGDLQSEFGELHLPSLAIGTTYSTLHLAERTLVLLNTGDDTMTVHVEIAIPAHHELRQGALPVPDRNWLRLERAQFVLPPHSVAHTDVHLTLPYEPKLAGHTYQADLWSRVIRPGSTARSVGQHHRLLFRVEKDYRDDTEIDLAYRTAGPSTAP